MKNEMIENNEEFEVMGDEEIAATIEENGVEEAVETGSNNMVWKLVGTAAASLTTGLGVGWFGRGKVEKMRRERMFDEIQKQFYLIEQASKGIQEAEWNGKLYATQGIHVSTVDELKAYIMDRILGDMKVTDSERKNWSDLLTTIVTTQNKLLLSSKVVQNEE